MIFHDDADIARDDIDRLGRWRRDGGSSPSSGGDGGAADALEWTIDRLPI
ncbi:MAG: hypothetical protein HYV93_05910 [Candidatus Rokubacteria bacterium]|nr:hypothetical protein [Candidatus Rokubacteria bacterium]